MGMVYTSSGFSNDQVETMGSTYEHIHPRTKLQKVLTAQAHGFFSLPLKDQSE